MKTFYRDIVRDSPLRVIDLVGHILLAVFLPGHWWYQFLPDILAPLCMLASTVTGEFLEENNPILIAHKFLHAIYMPFILAMMGAPWMAIHWFLHLVLDLFTHKLEWQRKSLWKV